MKLDRYEKAFLMACIDIRIEAEKKEQAKMKTAKRR